MLIVRTISIDNSIEQCCRCESQIHTNRAVVSREVHVTALSIITRSMGASTKILVHLSIASPLKVIAALREGKDEALQLVTNSTLCA